MPSNESAAIRVSNSTLPPDDMAQVFQFIAFGVVAGIISILGLIGNITSIRVLRTHRMKTSTSIYLIALAIFDIILLSCFLLAFTVPTIFEKQEKFTPSAPINQYFIYPISLTAHTTTVYIIVAFTVERYVAVCFPFKAARWCSRRQARKAVVIIVAFSFLYNSPRFFESFTIQQSDLANDEVGHLKQNESKKLITNILLKEHPLYRKIYHNYLYMLFMFFFPFLFLIVMNGLLIRAVRRSGMREKSTMEVRGLGKPRRRDTNLTVMLISVIIVFLICQAFPLIDNMLVVALPVQTTTTVSYILFYTICQVLVVINSAINFILYCCFGQKFRRAFLMICVCSWFRKRLLDDLNGSTTVAGALNRNTCKTSQRRSNRNLLITVGSPDGKQIIVDEIGSSNDTSRPSDVEPIMRTTCL